MNCKYDSETKTYLLPDGEVCKTDEYGDPTTHCTARRTCSQHVGHDELTCARCLGRTRQDIRQIVTRYPELLPEAIHAGLNSEAANLAGPACDSEAWSWRKIAAKQGRSWHVSLLEDTDEHHPITVLTTWARMMAEDYALDCPPLDLNTAAAFLERLLGRIAQDDEQDFPLLAREIRKCRSHLEAVLRDSLTPERGAPCPDCKIRGDVVRMVRVYSHWCDDAECEQIHDDTDASDVWVCPKNREHWRTHEDYSRYAEERLGA